MIFDKLFKKKDEYTGQPINANQSFSTIQAPSFVPINTSQNCNIVTEKENNVIVLWWIASKKKGYDRTTNKYPKWFMTRYGIDFNSIMDGYIRSGWLMDENNIVKVSALGEDKLKEYSYVIFIHENPQYGITINDFKKAPNLHKVQCSDIAWGVFNSRIMEYTQKQMWNSLAKNYANMANILIEEKRFEQAIEYIFATAFLETSGMQDNNELTPIFYEYNNGRWKIKYWPNGMPTIGYVHGYLEINNYDVTVPFIKVQEKLNLEWPLIKNMFLSSSLITALEGILPFKYFDKEQSFEIFRQAIEAGGKKGIFTLGDCSKKMKYNTPDEHSPYYFYASVNNLANRQYGR